MLSTVGNQLPILLISFLPIIVVVLSGWESVTNPLDKLSGVDWLPDAMLGISYQSS